MLLEPPRWRIGDQVQAVRTDTGRRVTGELLCYREADAWALIRLQRPEGQRRPIVRVSLLAGRREVAASRVGQVSSEVEESTNHDAPENRRVEWLVPADKSTELRQ